MIEGARKQPWIGYIEVMLDEMCNSIATKRIQYKVVPGDTVSVKAQQILKQRWNAIPRMVEQKLKKINLYIRLVKREYHL